MDPAKQAAFDSVVDAAIAGDMVPIGSFLRKNADALEMLLSDVRAARLGKEAVLADKLLDFGAFVNGVEDDCGPLMTALQYEHSLRFREFPDATPVLLKRGARVENVVTAAALGREDLVKSYIQSDGALKPYVPLVAGRLLRRAFGPHEVDPDDPKTNLELALIWAAMYGRTAVVDFLLQKGVNPAATDRVGTALHWAAWYGHVETLDVLLKHNPPLEAKNCFGGTVLDQTIWLCVEENRKGMDYAMSDDVALTIVQKLVDAGAKDPGWLASYLDSPMDERIAAVVRRVIESSGQNG